MRFGLKRLKVHPFTSSPLFGYQYFPISFPIGIPYSKLRFPDQKQRAYFLCMENTKQTVLQTLTRQNNNMNQEYCLIPSRWPDAKLPDFPLSVYAHEKHNLLLTVESISEIFVQFGDKENSYMRYY